MRIATLSLLTTLCLALSAPAFADLYNNGLTNGTSNAYFIDVYQVSDSFTAPDSTIKSFDVALWVPTGATPLTVDWSIGTTSFGSDLGHGSGSWTSLSLLCTNGGTINGGPCGGGFGYDVYDANMSVGGINGIYVDHKCGPIQMCWLTLTGATDSFSGRDAWDINSGASMAFHNLLGSVPSESFTINGVLTTTTTTSTTTTGTTPEPSSIMLLSSGVLGIAGVLRRRLYR